MTVTGSPECEMTVMCCRVGYDRGGENGVVGAGENSEGGAGKEGVGGGQFSRAVDGTGGSKLATHNSQLVSSYNVLE
ncbi:hypothetical protein Pcinc_036039 [Petrolisthes cinctipes]|uniref:Uncharacterized protein n=1 Tax=Petrolisthes cinctipes TaxID=88211 RepID=A0AAE1EMR3_PETCI|nr:hypothetical protein Pcinc_036039 [Petrolisthes cinctipes]